MKISDLKDDEIHVGMRVKGFTDRLGIITRIDYENEQTSWITWDGDKEATSSFNWNLCDVKVIPT